jgi:hypothetical protein
MIVLRRCRASRARFPLALLLLTAAPAALAQGSAPAATPTLSLPPITFSLPSGTPTPAPTSDPVPAPAPRASETPRAAPTPRATPAPRTTPSPRATPSAQATPRPRATPEPTVTPTSTPAAGIVPSPAASVAAAPVNPATPTPLASPTAAASTPLGNGEGGLNWLWLFGAALVAGSGWWWWRRRQAEASAAAIEVSEEPAPAPDREAEPVAPEMIATPPESPAPRMLARRSPAATPAVPGPAQPRPWIELELRARRAGVNLVTATADVEIVVRNRGETEARNVRIEARLVSARADQDAELGRIFAEASGRPAAVPFALAAGAERTIRALVTLPRGEINVLTAAGRPMFVPVVALNARYAIGEAGAGEGQTAQAFALGIERAGAAKLAPFWLDGPARMFESVAARPHALAVSS